MDRIHLISNLDVNELLRSTKKEQINTYQLTIII